LKGENKPARKLYRTNKPMTDNKTSSVRPHPPFQVGGALNRKKNSRRCATAQEPPEIYRQVENGNRRHLRRTLSDKNL
jgi:hypothetical protein